MVDGMSQDSIPAAARDAAVSAARGNRPFDLMFTGGNVVDVATGELRPADVGVVGPMIASVHPTGARIDAEQIVDVSGKFLAPGFFDMHVHFESSMLTPAAYADAVVRHGTTTVFIDPHELGNAAGLDGVRYAVDASRDLPVRFVVQAPSCVPPMPDLELSSADFVGRDVAEMLSWPSMAGVAEVMDMIGVLDRDQRMVDVVGAGLAAGKLVSGHAFGLAGPDLQAYLCAGITSDHELFFEADVMEKLRSGMTCELRYALAGFLPQLVDELNALPMIPTQLCTASDDVFAMDLIEQGHIDILLRLLIEHGLDPVQAYRCASINGAYRLGRTDLGLIGAGRVADILVVRDLAAVDIEAVYTSGVLRATDRTIVAETPQPPCSPPVDTVKVEPLTPDDFVLRIDGVDEGTATLRVIAGQLFTMWSEVTVDVVDGVAELPDGYLIQAAIHRYGRSPAVPQLGVLHGWGNWSGAMASTVAHDTHNLVVFGQDPVDMAVAANAVIAAGGGVAVASGGELKAIVELPIAGLLSPLGADEVAVKQHEVEDAAVSIGVKVDLLPHPMFAVMASSLACLPGPHLTDVGLVDGTTGTRVPDLVVALS